MEHLTLRFPGAILLSLVIALILSIIHLPGTLQVWRPEWVALVIIHWAILFPKQSSYLLVWVAGLLVDALYGNTIGQHALGFVIVLFISIRMSERIMPKTLIQYFFLVFIALGTYLLVNLWVLGLTKDKPSDWSYWLTLLSSLLAWPFVHGLLNHLHIAKKGF
jgi:rod shape-determining protein MreD